MKRPTLRIASLLVACAVGTAAADTVDCFPVACAGDAAETRINLCEVKAVREAARLDAKLKPAKDLYEAAVNPTGYAMKLVDRHVVAIPEWVGFAMDPPGYVRAAAMKKVRHELKKQVGLQRECAAEIAAEDAPPPVFVDAE